ncbi:MAG: serine/threonine protein kinase, partial [Nannocystaceae bacterium]
MFFVPLEGGQAVIYARRTLTAMEPTPFGEKYLLVEHIATGGMAEIYRAQYSGIEGFAKEMVVKRLREEFSAREEVVEMFLNEARIAATLTHNNIVHTYDLGERDGEYFIAMELLRGQELVAVLRAAGRTGAQLPLEITLGILMQALEGLDYVHRREGEGGESLGLIHRDLNPTNIHVGFDGVCKIVDFGIAATRTKALEGAGRFAGKLSYMSPEQVQGLRLDGRADLFAMAVMLYEMTLHRRLFRGAPDVVRNRIVEGDVDPPTMLEPDYPPALEAIVLRGLEVDPDDRFGSADEMFRALEEFCEQEGIVTSARKVSAFLDRLGVVEMERAAASESDSDLERDRLDDEEAAEFDMGEFDRLNVGDAPPDWLDQASRLPASSGSDGGGRGRTMTLGSLASLVEEAASSQSGLSRGAVSTAGSGMHAVIAEAIADEDSAPMELGTGDSRPSGRKGAKNGRGGSRRGRSSRRGNRPQARPRRPSPQIVRERVPEPSGVRSPTTGHLAVDQRAIG